MLSFNYYLTKFIYMQKTGKLSSFHNILYILVPIILALTGTLFFMISLRMASAGESNGYAYASYHTASSPTPTPAVQTTVSPTPQTNSTPAQTAIVISNILVTQITSNSAVISWNTNLSASGFVIYSTDPTVPTGSSYVQEFGEYKTAHKVSVGGLKPGTKYYFKVDSWVSLSNRIMSNIQNFMTLAQVLSSPIPVSTLAPTPTPTVSPTPNTSGTPVSTPTPTPTPTPTQTITERFYADPDNDGYGTANDYINLLQNSNPPAGYIRWITGRDNDNCPKAYNPDQKDSDKDGMGDLCDTNVTPTPTASASPTASPSPTPTPITTVVPPVTVAAKVFLRGDANQDNKVDQSDSITIRNYLNFGGKLACVDAADSNDDGFVTMQDVNYLQSWLFLGGTEPPSPGAFTKGTDPTSDDSGCGETTGSPTGEGGVYTDNLMFLRGDVNNDGKIDISDSIVIANHIQGNGRIKCSDAADANDDGYVNNLDYDYLSSYLFKGGPAPTGPTPSRGYGRDLTPDGIGCMDNSPALISDIRVVGITKSSAVVQWNTDKQSDRYVLYGIRLVNGVPEGEEVGSGDPLLRNHTVTLDNLKSGTKYYFQVMSSHDRGTTQGVSGVESFTTLGTRAVPVSSPAPQVSPIPSGSPKPTVSPKPAVSPSPSGVSTGDLVKEKGKPAVYVVVGDTIRPFLNARVFFDSGYTSFNDVKEVPTLAGYVQGIVITEPTVDIAPPGLPEVTPGEPVIISPKPSSSPAPSPSPTPIVSSTPVISPTPKTAPTPVTILAPVPSKIPTFLRGDANGDGSVDVTDPQAISSYINSAKPLLCKDAADVNDDGFINMADVALLQSWLFLGGSAPKPPYPNAGPDSTQDKLDCAQYPR